MARSKMRLRRIDTEGNYCWVNGDLYKEFLLHQQSPCCFFVMVAQVESFSVFRAISEGAQVIIWIDIEARKKEFEQYQIEHLELRLNELCDELKEAEKDSSSRLRQIHYWILIAPSNERMWHKSISYSIVRLSELLFSEWYQEGLLNHLRICHNVLAVA